MDEMDFLDKLHLDDSFDVDDARACFGALNYIMTNACTYQVPSRQLNVELEQLGLASEHCALVCKVLEENWAMIWERL